MTKKSLLLQNRQEKIKKLKSEVWIDIINYLIKKKNISVYFIGLEKEKNYYNNIAAKL
ncbi:MAG: hypothetical protein L6V95_14760 [Candidatus Melainabacteria bacterium]|nr:MAG: hypothetical protein L6V95_14760 [Candidatus Melainabacteria bacterium]